MTTAPLQSGVNAPMTTFEGLAEPMRGPRLASLLLVCVLFGLIAILIVWSRLFTLEIWATGAGRVTPSSQIQVVQNLEGGIVREVLVKEGERAKAGDVIARIDATEAEGTYQQDRINWYALLGLVDRLQAEAGGVDLVFSAELGDGSAEAAKVEKMERIAYDARRASLNSSVKVLAAQRADELENVTEARTQIRLLADTGTLVQRQLDLVLPQSRKGLISETEVLKIERERASIVQKNAELEAIANGAGRNAERIAAAIEEKSAAFRAEAVAELSEKRAALSILSEKIIVSRDRFTRREIRAPVDGVVKRVLITTPGEVIKPGDTFIELVPTEDDLLIEVRITPKDIGFIRAGQPARVRMTAYDSSIYGTLMGEVVRVGADTLVTKEGESFYVVVVRVAGFSDSSGRPLDVIAGMTADVSIVTGERTIFDYVFKPISKLREAAFADR